MLTDDKERERERENASDEKLRMARSVRLTELQVTRGKEDQEK